VWYTSKRELPVIWRIAEQKLSVVVHPLKLQLDYGAWTTEAILEYGKCNVRTYILVIIQWSLVTYRESVWRCFSVHIEILSTCVQAHNSWSRNGLKTKWLQTIDRILNNSLRSSLLFWLVTVDCCISLFFSLPKQYHLNIVVFEGLYANTLML